MSNEIFFSIIMPTYNSEKTLEKALKSIYTQNFDLKQIEILIIDGGSTDATIDIAKKYSAIVLDNPKRLPEYAKLIGFNKAKGEFAIKMDSDEEFTHNEILSQRYNLLKNRDIKCLIANELVPVSKGFSATYLNYCGDPFSFFVYNMKRTQRDTFEQNITVADSNILQFADGDVFPIGDGGTTTVSLKYAKKHFADKFSQISFGSSIFTDIISIERQCGCIENDKINHYVNAGFKTYLAKLRFRVINNLFHKEDSGFSSRESTNKILSKRKKIFILYTLSIICPLIDSVRLSLEYKDIRMMRHIFYLYYVCFYIVYCLLLKILGKSKKNENYGK